MGFGNVIANDARAVAAPTLSEATQQYLQLKDIGKAKTFHKTALRNAGTVIDICGDRVVTEYRTTDAGQVRDVLIDRGLSVLSVRRSFTTIKAIINLCITYLLQTLSIKFTNQQLYLFNRFGLLFLHCFNKFHLTV